MTTATKEDFEKWIEDLKERGKIDEDGDKEKFLALAFFGKLDTLKLFESLGMKIFVHALVFEAVIRGCGNIEFLDWLEKNYGSIKYMYEEDSYVPAKQGKLEVLKWMHKHGYKFNATTMANAIFSHNLNLVKWLYEDVCCDIYPASCLDAAITGNINMMQYLISKGASLDIEQCLETAKEGSQTAMVEWLKTQQPKPESKTKEIIELLKKVLVLLEDL